MTVMFASRPTLGICAYKLFSTVTHEYGSSVVTCFLTEGKNITFPICNRVPLPFTILLKLNMGMYVLW